MKRLMMSWLFCLVTVCIFGAVTSPWMFLILWFSVSPLWFSV